MARHALSLTLASILAASLSLAGCADTDSDAEAEGRGNGALKSGACDPSVTDCPPTDPNDGVCDPSSTNDPDCPCDAADGCPPQPDCFALAQTLEALLAEARACNLASVGPMADCRTFVPTVKGCDVPVALGKSNVTKKYLTVFEEYAASCPLYDPPCPDPTTLATGCVQGADVDSLWGSCAILPDSAGSADAAD